MSVPLTHKDMYVRGTNMCSDDIGYMLFLMPQLPIAAVDEK